MVCWGTTEPLQGAILILTTKSPEVPGTHLIHLGKMKDWVELGPNQWCWAWDLPLEIQHPNHKVIAPKSQAENPLWQKNQERWDDFTMVLSISIGWWRKG